jgi:hypothetical protein
MSPSQGPNEAMRVVGGSGADVVVNGVSVTRSARRSSCSSSSSSVVDVFLSIINYK